MVDLLHIFNLNIEPFSSYVVYYVYLLLSDSLNILFTINSTLIFYRKIYNLNNLSIILFIFITKLIEIKKFTIYIYNYLLLF